MSVKKAFGGYIAKCDAKHCGETLKPFLRKMMKRDFYNLMERRGWYKRKKIFRTMCLCPTCKKELYDSE